MFGFYINRNVAKLGIPSLAVSLSFFLVSFASWKCILLFHLWFYFCLSNLTFFIQFSLMLSLLTFMCPVFHQFVCFSPFLSVLQRLSSELGWISVQRTSRNLHHFQACTVYWVSCRRPCRAQSQCAGLRVCQSNYKFRPAWRMNRMVGPLRSL